MVLETPEVLADQVLLLDQRGPDDRPEGGCEGFVNLNLDLDQNLDQRIDLDLDWNLDQSLDKRLGLNQVKNLDLNSVSFGKQSLCVSACVCVCV